jgi:hypothetical protein
LNVFQQCPLPVNQKLGEQLTIYSRIQESGVEQALSLAFSLSCAPDQLETAVNPEKLVTINYLLGPSMPASNCGIYQICFGVAVSPVFKKSVPS